MNTLVAVVSTGDRTDLTNLSFPRTAKWAASHGYSVILIKHRLEGEGRLPHYAKLRVADAFPDFDRNCIVDDDILINTSAPGLPEVPDGFVGLVPDHEQNKTTNPSVFWTGNTGFLVFGAKARDLLRSAYDRGDDNTIWGIADQGALNSVLWSAGRAFRLDVRWNYMPILAYFNRVGGWDLWSKSRLFQLAYYLKLVLLPWNKDRQALRECHCCHLIRVRNPKFFDRIVPKNI